MHQDADRLLHDGFTLSLLVATSERARRAPPRPTLTGSRLFPFSHAHRYPALRGPFSPATRTTSARHSSEAHGHRVSARLTWQRELRCKSARRGRNPPVPDPPGRLAAPPDPCLPPGAPGGARLGSGALWAFERRPALLRRPACTQLPRTECRPSHTSPEVAPGGRRPGRRACRGEVARTLWRAWDRAP